jgi:hypothetical protein
MNPMTTKMAACLFAFSPLSTSCSGPRPPILSLLNRRISVSDCLAGQSFTLVQRRDEYFVVRDFFGSGLPVVGSITYKLSFSSGCQVSFSEPIENGDRNYLGVHSEEFVLQIGEDGRPELLLNGLHLDIAGGAHAPPLPLDNTSR